MQVESRVFLVFQTSGFLVHVGDQEIPQKTGSGQPLKCCLELCASGEMGGISCICFITAP